MKEPPHPCSDCEIHDCDNDCDLLHLYEAIYERDEGHQYYSLRRRIFYRLFGRLYYRYKYPKYYYTKEAIDRQNELFTCRGCGFVHTPRNFEEWSKKYKQEPCDMGEQICDECVEEHGEQAYDICKNNE